MSLRQDILDLAQFHSGLSTKRIEQGELFGPGGMVGDDSEDFLDAYAAAFGVDLSAFLDYFHYDVDEPPIGRRVVPVDENGSEIPYIRITLDHLVDAAERGRWDFAYPVHAVQNRWWVRLEPLLVLLVLSALLWLILAIVG